MAETKTLIELPDFVSVRDLASIMNVSPINVIKELMSNGIMANINQQIDFDTAAIVAFNEKVHQDQRVENTLLPIRDGIMVLRKK